MELKPIEEIFVRRGFVTELIVAGRTIGTTAEHPFFVHGRGWTAAGELHTGDLLAAADGRWLPVESRYNTGRYENVYNFRVAEHHTYFVQGDDWEFGVWAHNANYDTRVFGGPRGFSDPTTGHIVHQRFLEALVAQTGTRASHWRMRTAPGLTGVDATYIGPKQFNPGFKHAELKPLSSHGFETFRSQIPRWGHAKASVQLWFYNSAGVIGSSGYNY